MEATGRLYGGRVPAVCANTQEYFRDVYDHLSRMNGSIEAIRDAITTAIQVNLSMVAIEDSDIMKRLAAWSGIVGASIALAVLWEVFHRIVPVLDNSYGYVVGLGLVLATCGGLYARFRKLRWL
jgi:magnesium transporter